MITSSRILAVIAVLSVVGFGYWLEHEQPSEKNRVRHPQAYSVCVPEGWSAEVNYNHGGEELGGTHALDGLLLQPDQFDGIRPALIVDRLKDAPAPQILQNDGWLAGSFQDQPAYVYAKVLPHGLVQAACFQRSGTWFAIVERLSVAATAEKDVWWQFMETFRYPDGVAPTAAHPAAEPTTTSPASIQPFNFPAAGQ